MNFEEIIKAIDVQKDYTITEVANLCERSETTIRAHVIRKTFPSRRIFNRIYVKGIDLRNYLTGEK